MIEGKPPVSVTVWILIIGLVSGVAGLYIDSTDIQAFSFAVVIVGCYLVFLLLRGD